MQETISPDRLPEWVPGDLLLASDGKGWRQVGLRRFHYHGQDTMVPALSDYMLVSYHAGVTPMQRRFGSRWKDETVNPGTISLLTRAQRADWRWRDPITVTHLYLAPSLLAEVAAEATDCHVSNVELADVLRAEDPLLTQMVDAIAQEAGTQMMGGALYVESLSRALCVHLLRRYGAIRLPSPGAAHRLSPSEMRRIGDYIEENLAEPLTLAGMAQSLDMQPESFARRFRISFGVPPYRHVVLRRIARAQHLLQQGTLPLKDIAARCGFSDQAHLTRLFARETGQTPGACRKPGPSEAAPLP